MEIVLELRGEGTNELVTEGGGDTFFHKAYVRRAISFSTMAMRRAKDTSITRVRILFINVEYSSSREFK